MKQYSELVQRIFQGRSDLAASRISRNRTLLIVTLERPSHYRLLSLYHCVWAGGRRIWKSSASDCFRERALKAVTDAVFTGSFAQTLRRVSEDVSCRRTKSRLAKSSPSQIQVSALYTKGSSSYRYPPTAPITLQDDTATQSLFRCHARPRTEDDAVVYPNI